MAQISNQVKILSTAQISNSKIDPNHYKICRIWEIPEKDIRRHIFPEYKFTISGDRKTFNSISKKIQEQITSYCKGITDSGLDKFKTQKDAQDFANTINNFNKTMKCIANNYFANEEFQKNLDEMVLPHLIMDKLTEE